MKAFRIENPAKQLKNSEVLAQLIEEKGGNAEALQFLLDMYAKHETANEARSQSATAKQAENRAIKNEGGQVASKNDRIESAGNHLPALFELQMKFETVVNNEVKRGFHINASLLADCFFNSQFKYGKEMYDANSDAIDKANAKAAKAFKFEVDESGAVNVRKANGGLKSAYMLAKGFETQGAYLLHIAGIVI